MENPLVSQLLISESLDISALSRLFDKTTNSYKYIFLLSLLDIINRRRFSPSQSISFQELIIEMLANAWYPYSFCKLSFGNQDMILSQIEKLNLNVDKTSIKGDYAGKENLRANISSQKLDYSLMDYVPFRINTAFFRGELRGLVDSKVNATVIQLSNQYLETRKPLLKYSDDCLSVIVHPEWIDYFKINYSIIRGWISWEWLKYMQKCNPSTPAISNKLFAPIQRDSLKNQTEYWKKVLEHQNLTCIYSNQTLTTDNLSLDHYLPWSFVTHDLLWNLIPTSKEVNSSKSDNLPSNIYFDLFVGIQHKGLIVSHANMTERTWYRYIEPFIAELRVSNKSDLLEFEKLHKAYASVILPQLNIAISHGFIANWLYKIER